MIQPPKQSFTQQPPHQDNGGDVREVTHDQFKPVLLLHPKALVVPFWSIKKVQDLTMLSMDTYVKYQYLLRHSSPTVTPPAT